MVEPEEVCVLLFEALDSYNTPNQLEQLPVVALQNVFGCAGLQAGVDFVFIPVSGQKDEGNGRTFRFRDFQSLKAAQTREARVGQKQIETCLVNGRPIFDGVRNGVNLSLELGFGQGALEQQQIVWIIFEIQNPQRSELHGGRGEVRRSLAIRQHDKGIPAGVS